MKRRAVRTVIRLLAAAPEPEDLCSVTDPDVVSTGDRLGVLPVLASIAVAAGVIADMSNGVAEVLGDRREGLSPTGALLRARSDCRRRHSDLEELHRRTVDLLPDFRLVPLKGAAVSAQRIWPDPDARPQRDIDLWCPEASVAAIAGARLRANDYRVASEQASRQPWTDDHHDDALVVAGLAGAVELHRHPTIERFRWAATYHLRQTSDAVELTPESLMLHVIVHAQLQDFSYRLRRLPLVALLDVAYAIEAGFVTAEALRQSAATPAVRRAVEFHLYCVQRLRRKAPPERLRLRWRWWCALFFLQAPRLATLEEELLAAPHALSRPMMERRRGRRLGPFALMWHRARLVVSRGARTARRVRSAP